MYVKWTFQDMDSRLKVGSSPGLVMERLGQQTSDADLPGHGFGAFQPAVFFSDGGPFVMQFFQTKEWGSYRSKNVRWIF